MLPQRSIGTRALLTTTDSSGSMQNYMGLLSCPMSSEGLDRYLGVGSLRQNQNQYVGCKRSIKSSNVCWHYNGLGHCRQGCRFRHNCDLCGESHPRIECTNVNSRVAQNSQGGSQTQPSAGQGFGAIGC